MNTRSRAVARIEYEAWYLIPSAHGSARPGRGFGQPQHTLPTCPRSPPRQRTKPALRVMGQAFHQPARVLAGSAPPAPVSLQRPESLPDKVRALLSVISSYRRPPLWSAADQNLRPAGPAARSPPPPPAPPAAVIPGRRQSGGGPPSGSAAGRCRSSGRPARSHSAPAAPAPILPGQRQPLSMDMNAAS